MCFVRILQKPGEHVQLYALRVEKILLQAHDASTISDTLLLQKIMEGLWPSIRNQLPNPLPTTLDEFFCFSERIPELLSPDDAYWRLAVRPQSEPPNIAVRVVNEYASFEPKNPKSCYKCGIDGHFAWQCANARDRNLKKIYDAAHQNTTPS